MCLAGQALLHVLGNDTKRDAEHVFKPHRNAGRLCDAVLCRVRRPGAATTLQWDSAAVARDAADLVRTAHPQQRVVENIASLDQSVMANPAFDYNSLQDYVRM
jgi:hypothetical protein